MCHVCVATEPLSWNNSFPAFLRLAACFMSISSMLLILWAVSILSVYLQYLAWPALCKLLVVYGLGARIPVVIIMFFAL